MSLCYVFLVVAQAATRLFCFFPPFHWVFPKNFTLSILEASLSEKKKEKNPTDGSTFKTSHIPTALQKLAVGFHIKCAIGCKKKRKRCVKTSLLTWELKFHTVLCFKASYPHPTFKVSINIVYDQHFSVRC